MKMSSVDSLRSILSRRLSAAHIIGVANDHDAMFPSIA
jgi:hypothetical protein